MEDKDFIGQIFEQNCGDSLKIIEKTSNKKNGKFLYKGIFINYPYIIFDLKSSILLRKVNNPQIEQVEFIDKLWPQKCGDTLKIIKKSDKKQNNTYLWECEFINSKEIIFCKKDNILKGNVINNIKEDFIGKEFLQNCGDILRVIKKSDKIRIDSFNKKHIIYECEFVKYPFVIYAEKNNITEGKIWNPLIEEEEFVGNIYHQNCGCDLRVLRKTKNKINNKGNYLFECEFINTEYYYKCEKLKSDILSGRVDNLALPWKSKENLENYIKNNFLNKPTLQELSNKLNLSISHLSNVICNFDLNNLLNYYPEGSQLEKEIKEYIQSLLQNEKISNSWAELDGKEIDIYIPSLKLGFEYNGNYWHSELYKGQDYHQNKSFLAKEKGIRLIHIFEYEFNEKSFLIKNLIKSKLGIFDKKIGASKCKIKELDYKKYADFCNKNHLQGECGAKVKLGLFYKEELVQIMSFGSPRFNDSFEWEIIRECSKNNYIILGGKERLWSYFVKHYNPKNCISYCDFSKFTGDSYLKLGFKLERLNKPGFVWWDKDKNTFYPRTPWKHSEYKNKYLKIYDCGQLVFTWIYN